MTSVLTHVKIRSITLVLVLRDFNNQFLRFRPVATGAFLTLHKDVHALVGVYV